MTLSVYSWEDVHRYFPQKVVEQYRKQIIEEWKSGCSLSPKKLDRIKKSMNRAIPGVRKIANWFNGFYSEENRQWGYWICFWSSRYA